MIMVDPSTLQNQNFQEKESTNKKKRKLRIGAPIDSSRPQEISKNNVYLVPFLSLDPREKSHKV
jgi:hypothetical protein